MPNTYTQLYVQFVFVVKYRRAQIHISWKNELYKYITGIVQNNNHKLLCINGVEDHVHVFVSLHPSQSISNLLKDIKGHSSKWINSKNLVDGNFEWQSGFGAFSYSQSQVSTVCNYIDNQEKHHKKQNFIDEYRDFLNKFDIDYNEDYIFHKLK